MLPALVRRFPKLVWRAQPTAAPVPETDRAEYGELTRDFELLDRLLVPTFGRYDARALKAQNQFRRQQIVLIPGSAVATILGVLQAASIDGSAFAWTEAALAGLLAPVAARTGRAQRTYLSSRLKAERLRSEYFVFLARGRDYAGATTEEERTTALRVAVDAIDGSD